MVAGLYSCSTETSTDVSDEVSALISDATQSIASQDFETAMDKSLQALDLSGDDPFLQVQSLYSIIGIDIMASRDADAWEKALQAEAIARENGFTKELSAILVSKAKLCSYAEISPETGRNDEGLGYAMEALRLAKEADAVREQCEACYVIGSLYINKNRWSDPIDQTIYLQQVSGWREDRLLLILTTCIASGATAFYSVRAGSSRAAGTKRL